MDLKLLDFESKAHNFEIGKIEDIARITIKVFTGDEIAVVIYKDYTVQMFDAGENRIEGYLDYVYDIYHFEDPESLIFDQKFIDRKSSNWIWQ